MYRKNNKGEEEVSMVILHDNIIFSSMGDILQRCVSWILSLFCLLILGNTLRELHAFSNQSSNHHSDMVIRQSYRRISPNMAQIGKEKAAIEFDKFTKFGEMERNRNMCSFHNI